MENAKTFRLTLPTNEKDPMLEKDVCFDLNDNAHGTQLRDGLLQSDSDCSLPIADLLKHCRIQDDCHLLWGTVTDRIKSTKGSKVVYTVTWSSHQLGTTQVDSEFLLPARQLALEMRRNEDSFTHFSPTAQFRAPVVEWLNAVGEGESGEPIGSNAEEEMHSTDEKDGDDGCEAPSKDRYHSEWVYDEDADHSKRKETGQPEFYWESEVDMPRPAERCEPRKSKLKEQHKHLFATPMQSMLAFLPLKIFRTMVYHSNRYAHQKMRLENTKNISGARWREDITIDEMMQFFGILISMTIKPTPGQPYEDCWQQPLEHPYTRMMHLR